MAQPGPSGLLGQLLSMGFQRPDVERVIGLGARDAEHAVSLMLDESYNVPAPNQPEASQRQGSVPPDDIMGAGGWEMGPAPSAPDSSAQVDSNRSAAGRSNNQNHWEADPNTAADALVELAPRTEDEMLQQALDLSRKEAQTKEAMGDQEIQQVLAESLAVTNSQAPQTAWKQELPADPYDRVRVDQNTSVGLRNVGQTCYLNSLLQVYYHLADFRRAILSYRRPNPIETRPSVPLSQKQQALEAGANFVTELQRLFANMALTNTLHVDPSKVFETMRGPNGEPIEIGGQQDAAEFNQIFLEMVESGINANREPSGPNLVKDLCTFGFQQEIVKPGQIETRNVTKSGETNSVIVDAYTEGAENGGPARSLYDGLDDYFQTPIDFTTENGSVEMATKKVWLSTLAPVFTVYLQRVRYDRVTNIAEKVHSRFEFGAEISLDRFLLDNRAASVEARHRVELLKKDFSDKSEARSKLVLWGKDRLGDSIIVDSMDIAYRRILDRLERADESGRTHGGASEEQMASLATAHKIISGLRDSDMVVVREISTELEELKHAVDHAYDQIETKAKYLLFAVLVHDGDSTGGHYLAFVKSPKDGDWTRFSDLAVSHANSEEVLAASLGDQRSTSAYSLIYRRDLVEADQETLEQTLATESRKLLPPDLVKEVEVDNEIFVLQLEENRAKKAKAIVEEAEARLRGMQTSNDADMTDVSVFANHEGDKLLSMWFALASEYTSHFGKRSRVPFAQAVRERLVETSLNCGPASPGMMAAAILDHLRQRWTDSSCVISQEIEPWLDNMDAFVEAFEMQRGLAARFGLFCIMLNLAGRAMDYTLNGNFEMACQAWQYLFEGNVAEHLSIKLGPLNEFFATSRSLMNFTSIWAECRLFAAGCLLHHVITSGNGSSLQRSVLGQQIDEKRVSQQDVEGLLAALGPERAPPLTSLSDLSGSTVPPSEPDANFLQQLRESWDITQTGSNLEAVTNDHATAMLKKAWRDYMQTRTRFMKLGSVAQYSNALPTERGQMILDFRARLGVVR